MFQLSYTARRRWGRTLGCFWVPAVIALITIEDWLHVPQIAGWISLVGLFAGFLLTMFWVDRRRS